MNLLKPTECLHCGEVDEAKFVFSGPHIKQVCNRCGSYVKFISKALIPDATETRLRIWAIADHDLDLINNAKIECYFIEELRGVERNMMYWRLYLTVRRMIGKGVEV